MKRDIFKKRKEDIESSHLLRESIKSGKKNQGKNRNLGYGAYEWVGEALASMA